MNLPAHGGVFRRPLGRDVVSCWKAPSLAVKAACDLDDTQLIDISRFVRESAECEDNIPAMIE